HRDRWRWVATGVLAALCPIQAWSLLNGGFSSRPHYPLGASPAMLTRILAGDVYLGTLLGGNGLAASMSTGVFLFLAIAAVIGTAIAAFCFARSAVEMRLF